ncbi:YbaK/EbsC family protein [Streptomyces longispororuber]|uniref:YbaK/EbsC family protein n=1 Tax=Streptomyces longispororuber TaxID=68230 RepID=UPI0035713ACA
MSGEGLAADAVNEPAARMDRVRAARAADEPAARVDRVRTARAADEHAARVDRVRAALRASGAAGEVVELDGPAPTAAAAAARLGCAVGAVANSLVFAVDGAPLLVLTSGAHRVDTRLLARLLGVGRGRIRRADPAFVLAVTGQEVGGVAPVGHPRPVRTLVDAALAGHPYVWAGAGAAHAVFRTTFAELVRLTGGEAAVVAADGPGDR